jgi:hypothetical protein
MAKSRKEYLECLEQIEKGYRKKTEKKGCSDSDCPFWDECLLRISNMRA